MTRMIGVVEIAVRWKQDVIYCSSFFFCGFYSKVGEE